MHFISVLTLISLATAVVGFLLYRRRDSDLALGLMAAGAIGVLFFGAGFLVLTAESQGCDQKGEGLGRDSTYGLNAGCRIEGDDGRLVPVDNYRLTDEEE